VRAADFWVMTKKIKKNIKSNVLSQETIAEISRRGYEKIRLSRVKYKDNPYTFIDLRLFQIQQDEDKDILHPTKKRCSIQKRRF